MTLTKEPQLGFDEIVLNDAHMLDMCVQWDDTLESATANKRALKEVNKHIPKEEGTYRVGPYQVKVTKTFKVKILRPESAESAEE